MTDTTAKKIKGFAELEEGWNFGGGEEFSDDAIEGATRTLHHLKSIGFTETDAFPGLCGQISVTVYMEPVYLSLTVGRDGKLSDVETEEYHPTLPR